MNTDALAARLCDAHVAHLLSQLEGEPLAAMIDAGLDELLAIAGKLRLRDFVRAADVRAVARKYALEMELGGEMPGLVADIAHEIYKHKVHAKTTLQDLVPDRMFDEMLDKVLELDELRTALVHRSVTNPVFSALVAELLYTGIKGYVTTTGDMATRLPGARSALKLGKAVMSRANPELGSMVEDGLKSYVRKNTAASMAASEDFLLAMFEDDSVRAAIRELWDENKHRSLDELRGYAAIDDVEELFVILYEFWRHLRKTDFLGQLIDAGINAFYARHKDTRLSTLIEMVGIDRAMMREDALRFAPPAIATLKKKKLLEPLIRSQLEPFYGSAEVARILSAG